MKIDGRAIALQIYDTLKDRVGELEKNHIKPHMVVILVGSNPSSISYIKQKRKWCEYIGAKITVLNFPEIVTTEDLLTIINQLNNDPRVHGIIVQRPLPPHIDKQQLAEATATKKDIDGFHPHSPFAIPVALAVVKILEEVYAKSSTSITSSTGSTSENYIAEDYPSRDTRGTHATRDTFISWLQSKSIVCLGKGETAGQPIINHLRKLNLTPLVIDSRTPEPERITKNADIVISSVGKPNMIHRDNTKPGSILIGVGISKDNEEALQGDYNEQEIADHVAFYTPTPGGVGPVNVAYLLDNLVTSAEKA